MNLSKADPTAQVRREFLWRASKWDTSPSDLDWLESTISKIRRIPIHPVEPDLQYVWRELLNNLPRWCEREAELRPFAELLTDRCNDHRARNDRVLAEQDQILNKVCQAHPAVVLIKGAAMRARLDAGEAMNDTDVLVEDLDAGWRVAKVALDAGYSLEDVRLQLGCSDGEPFIVANFDMYRNEAGRSHKHQADWDRGLVRTLDIHVGSYAVAGPGVLRRDFIARSTPIDRGGYRVQVPCLEDMLLLEIAHLASHGTLSMRGINRCYRLLQSELDVVEAAKQVRRNGLDITGHAVVRALRSDYPALPCLQAFERELRSLELYEAQAVAGLVAIRSVSRYGAGTAASSLAQAAYIRRALDEQWGRHPSWVESLRTWHHLYRRRRFFPLAFRPWRNRRRGWLRADSPVTLQRIDGIDYRAALPSAGELAVGNRRVTIEPIGKTAVLCDRGQRDEVFLTPVGAFASAGYDGELETRDEEGCRALAEAIRTAAAASRRSAPAHGHEPPRAR